MKGFPHPARSELNPPQDSVGETLGVAYRWHGSRKTVPRRIYPAELGRQSAGSAVGVFVT
jgi:hypothetical protein